MTSLTLQHDASDEHVSSGLDALDAMLGGLGYYRGSTVMISGTAGTGKTTLAAHFADAACRRGERCLYFLFEESPRQLLRNMRSAGIDLERWANAGLLRLHADRPSRYGLETHLVTMHGAVEEHRPDVVIVDPMTNLVSVGTHLDVRAMLTRLIDFLKMKGITAFFTSLSSANSIESSDALISSLMDTLVMTKLEEADRRHHRWLYVMKSRGMAHSEEMREFRITSRGVDILSARATSRGDL